MTKPEYIDEDMANVGRALMHRLPRGYSYMNCPSEIVTDLQNEIADLKSWFPIDIAPKDGTPVLLFGRHIGATASVRMVGHYDSGDLGFGWIALSFAPHGPMQVIPTHWMPLPPAPQQRSHCC